MRLKESIPLRVRVELRVLVMKGYSTYKKSSRIGDLTTVAVYFHTQDTHLQSLTYMQRFNVSITLPQPRGPQVIKIFEHVALFKVFEYNTNDLY